MRRSWLALILVIVVIGVAVVLQLRSRPEVAAPGEEAKAQPASIKTPSPEAVAQKPPAQGEPSKAKEAAKPAKEPEPIVAEKLLKEAEARLAAGKPAEAQKLLSEALTGGAKIDKPDDVKARLTKLSADLLFSDKPCPGSVSHKVVAGDSLWKIAKAHKTTIELLKQINGLKSDSLRLGQQLKVIPGGFDVEVSKSKFRLAVYKDGLWVREFKVGLGKDGSTPVGEFIADHKLKEPTYFGDGAPVPFEDKKNNPLGTHWITIKGAGQGQYGIHGTWEPASIGKEESKGCVRMLNEDVEWLFALIVPGESKVAIKP